MSRMNAESVRRADEQAAYEARVEFGNWLDEVKADEFAAAEAAYLAGRQDDPEMFIDTDLEIDEFGADEPLSNPQERFEYSMWCLESAHRLAVEAGKAIGVEVPPLAASPDAAAKALYAAYDAALTELVASGGAPASSPKWEPVDAAWRAYKLAAK